MRRVELTVPVDVHAPAADEWRRVTDWAGQGDLVRHLGHVVQGEGVFEVVELGPQRARLLWTERLDLPLGPLGRLGWPVVRPAFRLGVERSLRTLAQLCERECRGGG